MMYSSPSHSCACAFASSLSGAFCFVSCTSRCSHAHVAGPPSAHPRHRHPRPLDDRRCTPRAAVRLPPSVRSDAEDRPPALRIDFCALRIRTDPRGCARGLERTGGRWCGDWAHWVRLGKSGDAGRRHEKAREGTGRCEEATAQGRAEVGRASEKAGLRAGDAPRGCPRRCTTPIAAIQGTRASCSSVFWAVWLCFVRRCVAFLAFWTFRAPSCYCVRGR